MKLPFLLYLTQIVFLAGTTLLLLFIVMSGSINSFPINSFYWLQADTSSISGAPALSRWTFWGLATVSDNNRSVSHQLSPAYPLSPVDNFGTTENVPQDFIDNRNTYYYLSRFAFVFYWIALAFVGISFLLAFFVGCSYSIIKIIGWFISLGLLFGAGAAAFMTAVTVLAKNAFHSDDKSAKIGVSLTAISWAAVACLIILFFISWGGLCIASYKKHKERIALHNDVAAADQNQELDLPRQSQTAGVAGTADYDGTYAQPEQKQTLGNESGIKFFNIRRHNDQESV